MNAIMSTKPYRLHQQYDYTLIHHGAKDTVTGSCHELQVDNMHLLIDCGLFQGKDSQPLEIEFNIDNIDALLVTHAHIDHIGRLPWLLAAGFKKPIYCTEATAELIPLMLDDGLKLQLGLNQQQREKVLSHLQTLIVPLQYGQKQSIERRGHYTRAPKSKAIHKNEKISTNNSELDSRSEAQSLSFCFQPAGHILGSAYIEIALPNDEVIVFSGDLGPRNTPLLPDPISPKRADYLIIETTYGDKTHDDVATRSKRLEVIVEKALRDGGVILIPAFSVGRTQELLFDIERLIEHSIETESTDDDFWQQLPIILDSPLAIEITRQYLKFHDLWDKEAQSKISIGRKHHPMAFEQFVTVESHRDHSKLVNRLASTNEVAIVVAASGMCNGGRIMNYLEALLPNKRTDVILAGYQAQGTLGRELQQGESHVFINDTQIAVNADIHTMSGYSAHADQEDLLAFINGIGSAIKQIHLIHGEPETKAKFADVLATTMNAKIIV